MIKFIGFKVNKGSFVPEGGTKEIKFNSRVICCITDLGLNDNCFGMQYMDEKIKTSTLAQYFGCADDDNVINTHLGKMLNQPIEFHYSPINGTMTTVGLSIVDKK